VHENNSPLIELLIELVIELRFVRENNSPLIELLIELRFVRENNSPLIELSHYFPSIKTYSLFLHTIKFLKC
jgi:hypothetical protein